MNSHSRSTKITLFVVALEVLGLVGCGGGGGGDTAAPAPITMVALPETGQTTCSDALGTVIPDCTGIGQDGDLQTGVTWPNPRFTAGSGATMACVTDNLTGLMWAQNADRPAGPLNWQPALDFANGLDLCGFTDWRLPNRKELRSLISYGSADNAASLNALGFTGVQANIYWTSSSYAPAPSSAWTVGMAAGQLDFRGKNIVMFPAYVWPVRAGQ